MLVAGISVGVIFVSVIVVVRVGVVVGIGVSVVVGVGVSVGSCQKLQNV